MLSPIMKSNKKKKNYLFKNGVFADGLTPSGHLSISSGEIVIERYFHLNYSSNKDEMIFVKWYVSNSTTGCIPFVLNFDGSNTYGFQTWLSGGKEYINAVKVGSALSVLYGYRNADNFYKIKEIWTEELES